MCRLLLSDWKRDISQPAIQGAVCLVKAMVQSLAGAVIPYSPLLILPLMRSMSNAEPAVRLMATEVFAELVKLLPLAQVGCTSFTSVG